MANADCIKRHFLVRFTRKSGKIDTTMSGLGNALMRMWAMQNTTKSKDTIIFDEDGLIKFYFEGTGDFPKITEYGEGKAEGIHHIDEFCEGLLAACKKDFAA